MNEHETEEPVMLALGDTGHPHAEDLPLEEQTIDERGEPPRIVGDNLVTAMKGISARRRVQ